MGNHFTSEVKLENDVYFPGNVVRGTAVIKIDKPSPCLAARISCRGIETAICVVEGTEHLHQDTYIFKETLTLFGHPCDDHDATPVEVPAGTYTYPFRFQLPRHLPNTIHMTNWASGGVQVRYYVSAFVKTAPDHFDEGHAEFTVFTPVNHKDVETSPPSKTSDLVHLNAHLTKQGTCGVSVHVNRSIYTPDETIEGHVTIDNHDGKVPISNIPLSLVCVGEAGVDKDVAGTWYNLGGSASETLVKTKLPCSIGAGDTETLALRIQLPHTIPYASYPSRGAHIALRHDIVLEVAGKRIDLPIFVAHSNDPKNRFDYLPSDRMCYERKEPVEYAYTVPDNYGATTCFALAPPSTLKTQPNAVASTLQAASSGRLTA